MGSQSETLLDVLRRHSQVDCDTFDDEGKFVILQPAGHRIGMTID